MKIIFLDIDGVLNSAEYRRQLGMRYYSEIIDRKKMPMLKKIVDATDAKIVLSTSWRKFWNERDSQLDSVGQYINEIFAEFDMSVYSKTPVIENAGRSAEITAWMTRKGYVDGYVILDDKDFSWSPELRIHFIRTDCNGNGLDDTQVQDAIDVLNGKMLPVVECAPKEVNSLKVWFKKYFKKNR